MAITYHAGRRIQGTSTDSTVVSGGWKELGRTTLSNTLPTPTVSDDLTTDKGWTATGTGNGYNASDYIDFKMVSPDASSGSDRDTVYIDLQDADYLNGSNISDSAFIVRCKINFSALAFASGNENRNYFGFFSDDAWGGTAQDFFVLQVLANTLV